MTALTITGAATSIPLTVQGVVEVDPRPSGHRCAECGPHGNQGRVCLLMSWVDCLTCYDTEGDLAYAELGKMLMRARGARQLHPEDPPTLDLQRLAPGRWSVRADVHRFAEEPVTVDGDLKTGYSPGQVSWANVTKVLVP